MSPHNIPNGTRYLDQIFDNINITTDIEFAAVIDSQGNPLKLHLDIYQPSDDTAKSRPVIMLIHGGGFKTNRTKQQSYIVQLATNLTKLGYVCIAPDYRVRNNPSDNWDATLTDAITDAALALDWVREHSDQYQIDRNKIAIGGGSAGGVIALNICYGDGTFIPKVDLQGVLALIDLWGTPSIMELDISEHSIPAVIVHGTKDEQMPIKYSEKLAATLKSKGVYHEFLILEDAPHTPVMHMDRIVATMSQFLFDVLIK
jgi:acetyl esterase/lipase